MDEVASGGALLYDLMIIRKQGKKRRIENQWRVQRGEQREEEDTYHAPGSRSYGMARQCSRGSSSCKPREVAGVTPTSSSSP
jgi:hypothetical protein